MGKQTQFHMLPADMQKFMGFVQRDDMVIVTRKFGESPAAERVSDPAAETATLTLWNTALCASLQRKRVTRPGSADYYRVDDSLPTLELSPSRLCEWNQKEALLQGRIYGLFETDMIEYQQWYSSLARWIRRECIRSPLTLLGGYIGPAAFKWFEGGGVLLPMFEPPLTADWLSFAHGQHPLER